MHYVSGSQILYRLILISVCVSSTCVIDAAMVAYGAVYTAEMKNYFVEVFIKMLYAVTLIL